MSIIVDYDSNFKKIETEVNSFELLGNTEVGYNAPKIVKINGILGYLKSSSNSTQTLDKFEFIIAKIGKYLNVKVADTYYFVDDEGLKIFSKSVAGLGEQFISFDDFKREKLTSEEIEEYKHFNSMLPINTNLDKDGNEHHIPIISTKEQLDYVFSIFIKVINKYDIDNKKEIITDYIKMVYFDCLIGNQDRNMSNYGLIKNGDKISFAPLFDNSTIGMPSVDKKYIQVNNYLVDRQFLKEYLISNYYELLYDLINIDVENLRQYIESLTTSLLDEDEKGWLHSRISEFFNEEKKIKL